MFMFRTCRWLDFHSVLFGWLSTVGIHRIYQNERILAVRRTIGGVMWIESMDKIHDVAMLFCYVSKELAILCLSSQCLG